MKANKTTIGILNFVIFASIVTLGVLSGNITGDYRIGTHLGMGLGMMGIITYGYLRERAAASLKDLKILQKEIDDPNSYRERFEKTEEQKAA